MRAGSDIGYCDSEYRAKHTVDNFCYTKNDIKANVEAMGFELEDVQFFDHGIDLYLVDNKTGIGYDFFNLRYDEYECYIRKDFLKMADEFWNKEELEK